MIDNKSFYDKVWKNAQLIDHTKFPVWSLLKTYIEPTSRLLEIGPGVRPRLPISKTIYFDISKEAVDRLNYIRSGCAVLGSPERMPFPNDSFDLICAFDVLEHIEKDQDILNEISRVLNTVGTFIFSVPLHQKYFSDFDEECGHFRRYEVDEIYEKLSKANLKIVSVSEHGLKPHYNIVNKIGGYLLKHHPVLAVKIGEPFYPLALRLRKKPKLVSENIKEYLNKLQEVLIITKKASA
ncbi:methyltransferase domain-containing protein [Patescibacteria group bacterium]|nr:methyltransferase domain-containing protein [Patescibacteria group bacterium]